MQSTSNESRLLLAIQALKQAPELSYRAAAKLYNIPEATLRHRMNGRRARQDTRTNSTKLTELEENAILQNILDLDSRGFPPRLADVGDMANILLAERDAPRVGQRWPSNFVKRHPDLRTRFNRAYDYQRALCEDPEKIGAWFRLVQNMRAKYGIQDADLYNFDETGFMIGIITPSMVVTRAERRGRAKTVQPGNREWVTVIQGVNAEGWCIPPYIVVKGAYHLANWYTECELPTDWAIKPTTNGWTDNETGLEWIRHFEKHTAGRKTGVYRMLVIDGHESHVSVEFDRFCKDHNIITISMPPHSSHLLQPLDVGCFSPLKRAYSRQIEVLMKSHVNHVTKLEFFIAFKTAFYSVFTEDNVKAGFRGAGLVPHDPEAVISKLDVKLRTPTPTGPPPASADPWVSQTPRNPTDAVSQTDFIKGRISGHQGSSPTPILDAIDQFAKGAKAMMHEVALLRSEVRILRDANEALSKRRRAKKTRVRNGGTLTIGDAQDLLAQKDADEQLEQETRRKSGRKKRVESGARRCGTCGMTGHNARTCENDMEMSGESSDE
jgi:hypothetical protein